MKCGCCTTRADDCHSAASAPATASWYHWQTKPGTAAYSYPQSITSNHPGQTAAENSGQDYLGCASVDRRFQLERSCASPSDHRSEFAQIGRASCRERV